VPRKKTTKSKKGLSNEIKKYTYASILLFFWIMALIIDSKSFLGSYYLDFLYKLFWEYYKWIFSSAFIWFAIMLFKEKDLEFDSYRFLWLLFYLVSLTTIIGFFDKEYKAAFNIYPTAEIWIWWLAVLFTAFVLFIFSLIILFQFSPISFIQKLFNLVPDVSNLKENIVKDKQKIVWELKTIKSNKKEEKVDKEKEKLEKMLEQLRKEKEALIKAKQPKQLSLKNAPKKIKVEEKWWLSSLFKKEEKKWDTTTSGEVSVSKKFNNWELPSINLLEDRWGAIVYDENEIRRKEIEIQEKLLQFKIEVEMAWYQVGPTVIQYRLKPKPWVSLNKIVNLKKDLTLALHAKNIRIQAPIPGLWVVGIEVPNDNRQAVWLKEVLDSREFKSKKLEIPLALWKDVSWNIVVGDLAKMPHLLIAWQTGSGKSVGMNWFLISMLYKFSPSELKFIMVDPKRVELSVYNGIPHLLTPVITNPDKALNALKWCVAEMLRRYDLAVAKKARNLQEYNAKVSKEERLPYIVIVVDELADLMMSWNKKEVESSIARIAQMARAVWMHLIVATQRPSTDVITWLIKANIPSRIAFTVASHIDSQTILWKKWAEDLLGRWDMLYYPTGALEPERVQWVLVETNEVEAVVNKIKLTIDPDMLKNMQNDEIVNWKSKTAGSILEWYEWDQEEDPEIIEKAVEVVRKAKKWSTSLIQRKLWLWYARAAKVLDILEELGVVWPSNWSKPREVYID